MIARCGNCGTANGQPVAEGHWFGPTVDGCEHCAEVAPTPGDGWPRHVGGGWFELSDGQRVRGKDDAEAAEAELHNAVLVDPPPEAPTGDEDE